ncbi:MAG: NAD(P)-binding domain-containing protein [Candidatus Heimdallarchaeota archaeon]|nr:NAD(P)-binding domain-containing protein [Candidatus Heimdallarchaeota archaeon]MBY8994865.1 NAD(P)-binding domain-containing protein [Candidatus Heimdallarchaeota archaeon]
MTKVFHESDGNLEFLQGKTISIIGYGNQGRAQALNLRDSGLNVLIGNKDDEYKTRAKKDGFQTYTITDAVRKSDIIFLLIPDEVMPEVFSKEIESFTRDNQSIVFASGYTIAFNLIQIPSKLNVLLLAPRMIGVGVRENYLTGEGFFSFISVHNDATGDSWETLLALCKGLGTLMKGAVEVTCKQEAVLDLFNEQAFGPAFGRVLLSSIYTLIEQGYPSEAVLIEMYMSEEMAYTYEKMARIGLVKQTNFHSHTSQYGAMSRGIKYMNLPLKKTMKGILKNIESGDFAREWMKKSSKLKFKAIKFFAMKTKINSIEQKVRKSLELPTISFDEVYYQLNEEVLKDLKSIKDEIKEFEDFFKEY